MNTLRFSSRPLLGLFALGLLGACGPSPTTITVDPPTLRYLRTQGQNLPLSYTVLDADGRKMMDARLRWTSSAPEVASVREDGTVVARKSGKTIIGVQGGRAKAALPLDLTILASLEVRAPGADFVEVGRTIKVRVVARNELGHVIPDAEPAFRSNNEAVARVENGELIAATAGVATVTATLGHLSRAIAVQVVPPDFVRLGLNLTSHTFKKKGQSVQVQARAYNRSGAVLERVPLEWFSSNSAVVTVSSEGRVTAVGTGRAVVSVVAGRRRTAADFIVE
ncbi:Ig-like domain-containing protein [Corallococcus sp. BB11-1]|uniref:Ig-like domain-containing protein n=1 Tax=Corallococcus sp. BB11-1 TaxID=2996783 RepID=UPI00227140E3|nr:Ig-like domain-containing protein [Corallococcus sp. BB11-1]MCY1036899.1 Ig-like domain-containing protein [Corallococcus sp. BB11-1]